MAVSTSMSPELTLRDSISSEVRPALRLNRNTDLSNIADRLVADALKRVSSTRRGSVIPKYPSNYFTSPTEESSSSSEEEEEATKRKKSKKTDKV